MRKFLTMMTVIATAMYITGCSKSDDTDLGGDYPGQQVEIKVGGKALSIDPIKTKSPFEGIAADSELKARVLASNTSKKYDAAPDLIKDGTMTFTPSSDAFGFDGGGVPYPHATNNVYLVGLYPTAPSADWTIVENGAKAKYTFNGSHDVMATNEITTVRKDGLTGGTYQTLDFYHLLTRLNLTVQAKDASAQTAWGKVTSIQVKSPANDVTVTFKTEDATQPTTVFGSTETIFPFYEKAKETALPAIDLPLETSSPEAQSYALVAPKDGEDTDQVKFDLIVTTENHAADYAITVPLVSTQGEFKKSTQGFQFNITLTFSATDIKAFATVKPWGDGGSGSATIQ